MTDAKQSQEKKLTPEEKARLRKLALANLTKQDLMTIASAAYVDSDQRYGDADGDAVDQFLYQPMIHNGVPTYLTPEGERPIVDLDPTKSRIKGKRYTGRIEIKEQEYLERAKKIADSSLPYVTVADLTHLMDYKGKIKKDYANQYIGDLLQSKDAKGKEVAAKLLQTYMLSIKHTTVMTGLALEREAAQGGLEEILNPKPERK